jgi:magnesium transporter
MVDWADFAWRQRKIDVVLDSVRRLMRLGATANLVNLLQKQHPADLAQVFAELGEKDRAAPSRCSSSATASWRWRPSASSGPKGAPRSSPIARRRDRPPPPRLPSDDAAAIIDNLPEPLSAAVLELIEKRRATRSASCSSTTSRPPAAS